MSSKPTTVIDAPGAADVVEWFGRIPPRFHDHELLSIILTKDGRCILTIHAWDTADHVDENGYFLPENHAVVEIEARAVSAIHFTDCHMIPAIIFELTVHFREE